MGYVIERVPENEKKGYMIPGYKEITPSRWVIDRDKGVKVFKYWKSVDPPYEEYFAIVYKEQVYDIELISDFVNENTVRWKAYHSLNLSEDILNELREAMKVYKLLGSPFINHEHLKVEIGF